jgi:hypothetical protein
MKYTAIVTIDGEIRVQEEVPVRAGIKGYVREVVKAGIFDGLTWYPAAAITMVQFAEIPDAPVVVNFDDDYTAADAAFEQDGEGM